MTHNEYSLWESGKNSLWNIEIVNYGLLYCIATTCHQIGKIVNETSYRVAESSQSFSESSCLVAESSCHRIGQLTNRPVPYWSQKF